MSTIEETTFATNNPYRRFSVPKTTSPLPVEEINGTALSQLNTSPPIHQLPISPPASPSSPQQTFKAAPSQPPATFPSQSKTTLQTEPTTSSTQSAPRPTSKPNNPTPRPRPQPREVIRTRSLGGPFAAAVVFERYIDLSPPTDDEIIIVTVRYPTVFRRTSFQENAPLPSRPPARGFLRRMSTRWNSSDSANAGEGISSNEGGGGEGGKYIFTAIKMPRRDYKKYFARDRDGKYIGTEPERDWTREELDQRFAEFQDMPLRTVPEYAEDYTGEVRRASQ